MPRKKSGTFDQGEYIREYLREHITYKKMTINCNNETDQMISGWIDSQPESTSAYLKRLVLEDMQKHQSNPG